MDLQSLWDFDAPAESERRFREALGSVQPASEDALVLRTQLARALGLQRRFDDAAAELDAVAAELDAVAAEPDAVAAEPDDPAQPGGSPLVRTYLALERGRVARSSGDAQAARPLFHEALDTAAAAGIDHLAADAAHMLAITCEGEEQVPWARRALEIASSSADPRARRWVASVTHNLGWTMHDLGRYEEALSLWERALAARLERDGDPGPVRVARWTVARGLRSVGRHDEALAIQRSLLTDGPEDGYVHRELAELLTALGRPDEAAPHAARAKALLADQDATG